MKHISTALIITFTLALFSCAEDTPADKTGDQGDMATSDILDRLLSDGSEVAEFTDGETYLTIANNRKLGYITPFASAEEPSGEHQNDCRVSIKGLIKEIKFISSAPERTSVEAHHRIHFTPFEVIYEPIVPSDQRLSDEEYLELETLCAEAGLETFLQNSSSLTLSDLFLSPQETIIFGADRKNPRRLPRVAAGPVTETD